MKPTPEQIAEARNQAVYSYQAIVRIPHPNGTPANSEYNEALKAINSAIGWIEPDGPDPDNKALSAHRRLATTEEQIVTVDVFADGSRNIRIT
jgi:hypothetical protein